MTTTSVSAVALVIESEAQTAAPVLEDDEPADADVVEGVAAAIEPDEEPDDEEPEEEEPEDEEPEEE